ncbi:LysR family transcriptional regulator [Rhodococcus koreensis]
MEQRQLEFFVAVAEELNFTRAAVRTHAVQSTVSASIRTLERNLGTQLFDRSTTKVTMTPAGLALLPRAKDVLESLHAARSAVEDSNAGVTGSLRIGTLSGLTTVDLPALVRDFRERHPKVHLHMTVEASGTTGLLDNLRKSILDAAFVGVNTLQLDGIELDPISTFEPRLLVGENHPLAQRDRVSIDSLAHEPFIDLPLGFCNRVRSDNDFRQAGITRNVVVEVSDLTTIPSYVESGIGIALVPPLRTDSASKVVAVQLDPPATPWTLALGWSSASPTTGALRAFINLIAEHTIDTEHY